MRTSAFFILIFVWTHFFPSVGRCNAYRERNRTERSQICPCRPSNMGITRKREGEGGREKGRRGGRGPIHRSIAPALTWRLRGGGAETAPIPLSPNTTTKRDVVRICVPYHGYRIEYSTLFVSLPNGNNKAIFAQLFFFIYLS